MARSGGDGVASTLDLYMRDMARHPLLDAQEEIALAEAVQRGKAAERRLKKRPVPCVDCGTPVCTTN
jgi:DNA-directed RNA polymerase sigma subunit (sigma70/sigma32)